ncbi:unnamed protein product, partial [Pylaiella littoralis]
EGFYVAGESLERFRACCRVLGTVLQHYARKVYSCTPPFASLCRSLLRLFFRLVSAPPLVDDSGTTEASASAEAAEAAASVEGVVGRTVADS